MTPAEYQAAREAHARHVARMAGTLRGVRLERATPAPAKPRPVRRGRRGRGSSIWRMVQTAADAYRRQGYGREKSLRAAVGLVEAWQACPRVEFAKWLAAIEPRVAA